MPSPAAPPRQADSPLATGFLNVWRPACMTSWSHLRPSPRFLSQQDLGSYRFPLAGSTSARTGTPSQNRRRRKPGCPPRSSDAVMPCRKDDYRSQSPNPAEGLVFLSGERAKTITFRHSKDADGLGKTVVLTLGKPAEIGLRRSDGRGPDAPHLKTGSLLLRSDQRHPEQVHPGNHAGLRSGPPDFRQQPLSGLRGGQRRRGTGRA